jgi:hypothetical protein
MKGRDYSADVGVKSRSWGNGMGRCGLNDCSLGQGPVVDSCEHSAIKVGNFLTSRETEILK